MADDDSGSDFDPRFGNWLAPPGTATSFGTPSSGSLGGQPLDEWVKQVTPDELANYTQNPDDQIAKWHGRGIDVPDAEHIHAANDQFGTPSRPQRLDQGPASPLDQAPIRMNPDGTIAGNITGQPSTVPLPRSRPSNRSLQMGFDPAEETGPPVGSQQGGPPSPSSPIQRFERWRNPNLYPPPEPEPKAEPKKAEPEKPPEQQPAPVPAVPALQGGANKQSIAEKVQKNADITTPEGRQNVSDAIGTLGKAMQGVKAPEPLRPPQIGAPAAPHPLAANAPQLAGLLGLAGGGRPAPPILRLLGR